MGAQPRFERKEIVANAACKEARPRLEATDMQDASSRILRVAGILVTVSLSACASLPPTGPQTITVNVRTATEDTAPTAPLACQAYNSTGRWQFTAPGMVSVERSTSPLQISCNAPADTVVYESTTAADESSTTGASAWEGTKTGTKIGVGVGLFAGVGATVATHEPIAFLITVMGGGLYGALIGSAVGALTAEDEIRYPDPIVIRAARTSQLDREEAMVGTVRGRAP